MKSLISLTKISTIILLIIIATNCKKESKVILTPQENNINNLVLKSLGWDVTFSAGHSSTACFPGCVPCPYTPCCWMHVPCWDFGHECTHKIGISILKKKSTFSIPGSLDKPFDAQMVLIDETADTWIPFPSRSFSYSENNLQYWLNIPKQNVLKIDKTENVYILKDIYFSRTKAFENN